jgi:hypothetical protein
VKLLNPDDWRRGIALVILWAYGYQLVAWPLLFWMTLLISWALDVNIPAPTIVPWEQLIAGTATLGTVGGIQTWREKGAAPVGHDP